ncbi:MAG: zf-HC2 domain-containing protein [Acidimicrobiia bacterium]|nr:zf-HC2 domain-containing protein [Acidimicrobiia bacterium]
MTHPGDLLSALLDGELSAPERQRIDAHLTGCADCRLELEAIESVRSAVRSLPTLGPPPGLLPGSAPARKALLRPVWGWAAAGAMAVALSLGLAIGTATSPAPMDLGGFAGQHTARVLVQPGVQTVRAVWEAP